MVNVRSLLIVLMTFIGMAAGQSTSEQLLYNRFFDEYYFPFNPTTATASGIHKYDGQLEDYSKAGIVRRTSALP